MLALCEGSVCLSSPIKFVFVRPNFSVMEPAAKFARFATAALAAGYGARRTSTGFVRTNYRRGARRFMARRAGFRRGVYQTRSSLRTRYVRSLGSPFTKELKYSDVALSLPNGSISGSTTTSTGTGGMCLIAEGDDIGMRDGRKILLKSILIQGTVGIPAGGTVPNDIWHIYVILDTQANGAFPGIPDIFRNGFGSAAIGDCLRNLDYGERFKILAHKMYKLSCDIALGGGLYDGDLKQVRIVLKNLNIQVNYSGVSSAIANVTSNNILLAWGGQNLGTNFLGYSRIRYYD